MSSVMRQHVPKLTDDISNNEFLDLIVDCFHSAIFGIVDENGEHHTNVIDIDFNENVFQKQFDFINQNKEEMA